MSPMTDVQLPNEEPDAAKPWLDYRGSFRLSPSPRRGLPSAKAYEPNPDMPGHWRHVRGLQEGRISTVLNSPATDPAIAAALRAYLDGEPDPLGAAAAFETACAFMSLYDVTKHWYQFDAWTDEHGPEFAACATLEQCAIRVIGEQSGKYLYRPRYEVDSPAVAFAPARAANEQWGRGPESFRLRGMLSVLPEAEYRRYRELFEPLGRNHRQRLVRAFAMPTEQDWVDEVCAEWPDLDYRGWGAQDLIAGTVSTLDQLRTAGVTAFGSRSAHNPTIGSAVEMFGVGAVPILFGTLRTSESKWMGNGSIHEVLSGLPHDEAVEYLLRNMVTETTFPLVPAMAERFPRRTLRVVAAICGDVDAMLRSRFAHLVATVPMLEAARDVAEPEVQDAIERLMELDGAPPETADLPEFLATPPWKRKGAKRKKLVVEVGPVGEDGLLWLDGEQEAWREGDEVQRRLAEADDPADVLASLAKTPNLHRALPPITGVTAARLAADWLVRLRSTRLSVGRWLDRHGLDAAAWLVPDAVGKAPKPRKAAEAVLRDISRRFGDEAVIAAAAAYAEEAAASVAEILAVDPLDLDGRKAPKVPAWAEPVLRMPVLLRGGKARLPREAVEHVVGAMALDSPAIPYAGIDIVKEHCDPASLSALSWAVLESWTINDAPAKDTWALTQLARFADADAVARLEGLIRAWPDQNFSKRALNGLEVLGSIESEEALRAVHRLTRFRGSKAVKAAAVNQVELVAAGLGLDAEQLADRLVPEQGPSSVTAEQVKRLEKAMVNGRTWTVGEFRTNLVAHPLLWELVRRLVWQCGPVAFRLAEDRTLADVEDEAIDLPDDAQVRLSHPVLLGDALGTWVQSFTDYEVLQPFDQLARAPHTATAAETAAGRLTRFEGRKAKTGPLHGLTRGEWTAVRADNWTNALERRLPGGGAVHVVLAPGFGGGPYFDAEAVQVLEAVRLPPEIDAVALAEVIADLGKVAKE
jgi:hypothetical protein